MRITAILACDQKGGIGIDGGLPWSIPDDLRFFRSRTLGTTVIMGSTTYAGLKGKLDDRNIIVLSSTLEDVLVGDVLVRSPEEALSTAAQEECTEVMVIGGSKTYDAFLPYLDRILITSLEGVYRADTFLSEKFLSAMTDRKSWKVEELYTKPDAEGPDYRRYLFCRRTPKQLKT